MDLDHNASIVWLASTAHRKMAASALKDVDVSATARRVNNPKGLQSLRVEGHLMYGVANIVAQKAHLLASRAGRTFRELDRELGGDNNLRVHNSPTIPTQSQSLAVVSSDFNLDRVVDEFRPSQLLHSSDDDNDAAMMDLSIDDEMRGGSHDNGNSDGGNEFDYDAPMMDFDDDLRHDDTVATQQRDDVLTEGDEQILRGIFGSDGQLGKQTVEGGVGGYAPSAGDAVAPSSPAEAQTPEQSDDEDNDPAILTKKNRRPSKKRVCPIDERTTVPRPTRAPADIILAREDITTGDDDNEAEEDDFLDPVHIADTVKRRRLADIPSDLPDLERSDPPDISIAGISMDDLMDDHPMGNVDEGGDDYGGPMLDYDNDEDGPGPTLDVIGSLAEQENLEELMAQEIQAARRTIKNIASPTQFSMVASGDRRSRAALLSEMLALATQGDLEIDQSMPYSEIAIGVI